MEVKSGGVKIPSLIAIATAAEWRKGSLRASKTDNLSLKKTTEKTAVKTGLVMSSPRLKKNLEI